MLTNHQSYRKCREAEMYNAIITIPDPSQLQLLKQLLRQWIMLHRYQHPTPIQEKELSTLNTEINIILQTALDSYRKKHKTYHSSQIKSRRRPAR